MNKLRRSQVSLNSEAQASCSSLGHGNIPKTQRRAAPRTSFCSSSLGDRRVEPGKEKLRALSGKLEELDEMQADFEESSPSYKILDLAISYIKPLENKLGTLPLDSISHVGLIKVHTKLEVLYDMNETISYSGSMSDFSNLLNDVKDILKELHKILFKSKKPKPPMSPTVVV